MRVHAFFPREKMQGDASIPSTKVLHSVLWRGRGSRVTSEGATTLAGGLYFVSNLTDLNLAWAPLPKPFFKI